MSASFERFCLAAGLEALAEMMERDALAACGERHERGRRRTAHRWGKAKGKIGFHGGKVEIERPRLRSFDGKERALPSWEAAQNEDWLGKWAMNQMLINVSTRKFQQSMRLPEGDVPAPKGSGLSKSADRLPKSMHAQVRRVLRQAWEMDDADKAEQLLRNLARRFEKDWEGVSASILEGLDEMLTVTRLGLPPELRRSLACTNIIENVMGTVRRVCRNVKYWRSSSMALRWAGAAMQEAAKGFRRLKAHKQLPLLKAALAKRKAKAAPSNEHLAQTAKAA